MMKTPMKYLLLLLVLTGGSAMALEEPEYDVLFEGGSYEVRRYAPYIIAEVDVPGDMRESGDEAFGILAGYIFGDNRSAEKMSMTAPVESRPSAPSMKMAMTAPVFSSAAEPATTDSYTYAFVMERKYDLDTLPEPTDPRIRLREVEPRTVAALRYSGRWTEKNYLKAERTLLEALGSDGITTRGVPALARYNAPFMPPFLRRNEVLIEIEWLEPASDSAATQGAR